MPKSEEEVLAHKIVAALESMAYQQARLANSIEVLVDEIREKNDHHKPFKES